MGRIPLFILFVVAMAGAACAPKPDPNAAALNQADVSVSAGDRTDCNQIYGTSFRSPGERGWFEKNCTQWPFFNPTETPATANYVPTETCDQVRGRPYTSEGQHQWYLANCLGTPQNPPAPTVPGQPPPGPAVPGQAVPGQPVVIGGPDRSNCAEIKGTAYRSPTERTWYLANCMATPTPPPAAPAAVPGQATAPPVVIAGQPQTVIVTGQPPAQP